MGLCGEMAADRAHLPLLLGLSLDEISTSAPQIPALKAAIARLSAAECRAALQAALACSSVADVEHVLATTCGRGATHGLLDPECITVGAESATKDEAIADIVDTFHAAGRTEAPDLVEDAVQAREAVYSTGLGYGFAIPHCKTDAIASNSVGVVRLQEPIDWGSVDGEPVRCVILLAMRAAETDEEHLRIFATLARKLMHEEFRERMLAAPDRAAVIECLQQELGLSAGPVC